MFIYFYPPYVALCASKAWQRFGSEKLSWCLETFLFLRLSSRDGNPSLPLLSLFLSFILFPTYFPRVGFFSGCLMSSGSIHKLYCGIYSTFKCSFDEIVWGGKEFSPSYSSAILAPLLWSLERARGIALQAMQEKKALISRCRGSLVVFLELRCQCGVSHKVRPGAQGTSRVVSGKSSLHTSGEGAHVIALESW